MMIPVLKTPVVKTTFITGDCNLILAYLFGTPMQGEGVEGAVKEMNTFRIYIISY